MCGLCLQFTTHVRDAMYNYAKPQPLHKGARCGTVEELRYKPEGRWFDYQ